MTSATLSYLRVRTDYPKINWKIVCLLGFFMCLPLLVLYVWQINTLTSGSYLVNSYEKQISKLSEENKNLQVSFAENSFLGEAFNKIQALNFQKVTAVKYVQIPDGAIGYNYKNNIK